jgi:hypothetical protein
MDVFSPFSWDADPMMAVEDSSIRPGLQRTG